MPSTYSLRFRLNLQAPGENINTWGTNLNAAVFQLLEDALAKRVAFTLSGSKTLTSANGASDEARCMFLDITGGTGGAITAPAVEKIYLVRNGASGDVTVGCGAGVATIHAGEVCFVVGDATNFARLLNTDFGGKALTNVASVTLGGAPTADLQAATKKYVDDTAWATMGGTLPGQGGNAGKFLSTNGTVAGWSAITTAAITDYATDQAARAAALLAQSIAFASVL